MALLALGVAAFVLAPLRPGRARAADSATVAERADLEAARDAKYAEIRELELDHRTGKVSPEDFRAQDRTLRGEAVELLRRLDAVAEAEGAEARAAQVGARAAEEFGARSVIGPSPSGRAHRD